MNTLIQTAKPVKTSKARKRPERTLRLYDGSPALLEMTIGRESFSYWLTQIPSDRGQGFELRKPLPDTTTYHILLDGPLSSCECQGFLRHNHCKHVEALQKLVAEGKLAGKPAPAAIPAQTEWEDL